MAPRTQKRFLLRDRQFGLSSLMAQKSFILSLAAGPTPPKWHFTATARCRWRCSQLQRSLIRSHAAGAGATVEPEVVDLPLEANLPVEYVPDEAQKLELYRRLRRRAHHGGTHHHAAHRHALPER